MNGKYHDRIVVDPRILAGKPSSARHTHPG